MDPKLTEYLIAVVGAITAKVTTEPREVELSMEAGDIYPFPDSVLRKKMNSETEVLKKRVVIGKLLYENQTEFASSRGDDGTLEYLLKLLVSGNSNDAPIDVSKARALQARKRCILDEKRMNVEEILSENGLRYESIDLAKEPPKFTGSISNAVQGTIHFWAKSQNIFLQCSQNSVGTKRLVITPSFDRYERAASTYLGHAKCNLWPDKETIHIILVQPYQLSLYVAEYCTRGYVVVSMPANEEGVGSARFWAGILADVLGYKQYFMLDDSYSKEEMIKYREGGSTEKGTKDKGYPLHIGVGFIEQVFAMLTEEIRNKVGVMSLRRHGSMAKDPVVFRFCQGFVFVNGHRAHNECRVYYRRGLLHAEDFLFSQACLEKGLFPVEIQHLRFYDLNITAAAITNTGAHSSSLSGASATAPVHISKVQFTKSNAQSAVAADSLIAKMQRMAISEGSAAAAGQTVTETDSKVENEVFNQNNLANEVDTIQSLGDIWSLPADHHLFSELGVDNTSDNFAPYVELSRKHSSKFSKLEQEFVQSSHFVDTMILASAETSAPPNREIVSQALKLFRAG